MPSIPDSRRRRQPQGSPATAAGVAGRRVCGLALAALAAVASVSAAERSAPVAVEASRTEAVVREERVSGTVTSPRSAALSTQVAGMVAGLSLEAGDRVAAGDVVVELDRELIQHRLDVVRAEARRAGAALDDARRRLAEGRALVEDGSIPRSDFEERLAAEEMAAAELAASRAEARRQQALLARTRVTAPFDGVVRRRLAELGEWLEPGDTVMEVVASEGLRFDFQAPQALYPLLTMETPVSVRLEARPEQEFPGRIAAIVAVGDPDLRTFLLRVRPADAGHPPMIPGMAARARLAIDLGRRGVTVPRDALLRHPDGRVSVWVVEETGEGARARERLVKLGLAFGERVEVREGLEAGVPVVVEGNEALEEGRAVRVQGAD